MVGGKRKKATNDNFIRMPYEYTARTLAVTYKQK